ncbi:serine carboxypeptidase S28-domain-containing protein [Flagelloscypha sp. PMI_526]|nr:serine carboxypeptidase S28-domain-containing protein [Flagelloscypha sp. PMI_526]
MSFLQLGALASIITFAVAQTHSRHAHPNFQPMMPGIPIVTEHPEGLATAPPLNFTYYFDQLIDHDDPSKGTFKQRYWHNAQYYQTGGPIILMTPGEANAAPYTGYMTNVTMSGKYAELNNGTTIILEHRYYGLSNPYPDLSTASLKYNTLDQAIEDLDYFAHNVVIPQDGGDKLTPNDVPWVNMGGSYSGALVSWARHIKPDLFWIGYSSSGVVTAINDFWGYFEPIRLNMAKLAVITYVDKVFTGKNQTAIQELKENWGLGDMTHLDDVAGALRNNLWDWQSLQPTVGYATFFQFCDALEVKDGVSAPEGGWGLEHALPAWGNFWKNGYLDALCGDRTTEDCLGTWDPNSSFYTNTEIDNVWRSWNWIVCNDVGWLQEGTPKSAHTPTLVSRLIRPPYELRQCQYMYPEAFPTPPQPRIARTNAKYGNWKVKQPRTYYATGVRDPWRYATMSAPDSPAKDALDKMTAWLKEWKKPTKHHQKKEFTVRLEERELEARDDIDPVSIVSTGNGAPALKPVNAFVRGAGSF